MRTQSPEFCLENGLSSHSYHMLDVRNSPNIHFIFKSAHLYFLEDLHFDPKTLYVMFFPPGKTKWVTKHSLERWAKMLLYRKWEAMVYFSRKHVLWNHRSQILLEDDCVAKFKDFSILCLHHMVMTLEPYVQWWGMIPDFTWSSVLVWFKIILLLVM